MPDRDGVEIFKRFYPWPDRFRLGDPVLVKEVTGMSWPDFAAALDEQNRGMEDAAEMGGEMPQPDQVVLAGLIAVAFWQGNPQMSRDKARRALERIPMDDIEVVGGDEDDVDPPAQAGTEAGQESQPNMSSSETSPEEATEILPADYISDVTSPNGSGSPGSPSSLPESLPA